MAETKTSLSRSSTSFLLRSASLNTLRLRRLFDNFDKNRDGEITIEELRQTLYQLGLEADNTDLDCTVRYYIKPGNSGLKFEDFQLLHQSLSDKFLAMQDVEDEKEDSDIWEAFKVFDEDGDGFISVRELQTVLEKLGLEEGKDIDRVQLMISSVDRNKDGKVDFFEFKHMMQSVSIHSS